MTDRIKKSDLTHIGKRLPYTVPDDFFEQFEADIWQAVQPDLHSLRARRPLLRRLVWGIVGSVAAALVIGFMLIPRAATPQAIPYSAVEQAFDNLSQEDQTYLLSTYENDPFFQY